MRAILLGMGLIVASVLAEQRIINGTEVGPNEYKEVVRIQIGTNRYCTGTIVGPRVVLTAANCVTNDQVVSFSAGGQPYTAKMKRSHLYPGKFHNIALGVMDKDIQGVSPAAIGGTATVGAGVKVLGYGSKNPECTGVTDGKLRKGDLTIAELKEYEFITRPGENGALVCFDDMGGPAYMEVGGKSLVIGVTSQGDIHTRNHSARTDHEDSKAFFTKFISENNSIAICGVNSNCNGVDPVKPPRCELTANPSTVKKGQRVDIVMKTFETVTAAKINGTPIELNNPHLSFDALQVGTQTATGEVSGNGQTASCQTSYTVVNEDPVPTPPTCRLTATPSAVKKGEKVVLEIRAENSPTEATIDGVSVQVPVDRREITTTQLGTFTATGTVKNSVGSNSCTATYSVGDGPIPTTPNFAVVTTYCGDNSDSTPVKRVCLGVVRKDAAIAGAKITDVLEITFNDQTKDVVPVLYRSTRPSAGDGKVEDDLITYGNRVLNVANYEVLDTQTAILTKTQTASGEVPVSIMGWTATYGGKKHYFIVNRLN